MMRTSNPALNSDAFFAMRSYAQSGDVMTLDGTINKSLLAILITMASAYATWFNPGFAPFMLPAVIGGFVVSLVIIFKKNLAPILTPVYAVCEGCILGTLSMLIETRYPGVAVQAVSLTFGTLVALLLAYRSGLVKASDKLRLGIVAATGAIALVYLVNLLLSLFGHPMGFLYGTSNISIGFSLVVVVVAALNLVLDFDFIEKAARSGSVPKYMEWYGAFGLLVTLVWLYIEFLKLLTKLRDRNS